MNDILKCAKTVLDNTDNFYMWHEVQCFIEGYSLEGNETGYWELLDVFTKICEDGFDMTGFGLHEIPHPSVYVFYNEAQNQMFDICIDNFLADGEVCISFCNSEHDHCVVKTIQEAIMNYDKTFLL